MTYDILPLCRYLPAIGTQYFPWTDNFMFIRGKTLWESHQQHIPHLDHWEQCPGRSVLGVVFDMNTGHYFNAFLLLLQCPCTQSHICIYTACTSSPSVLFQTSANPFLVSDLSGFKWMSLAMAKGHINASKGFCCERSFSGLKQKDILSPKTFSPQAAKVSYYLCCTLFEIYVFCLKIQQNTATFARTRS